MNYGLAAIYIITGIGLLFAAHGHGKPAPPKQSFWWMLARRCMWLVLVWWALGWRFS